MKESRFTTICLLYCGVILVAQSAFTFLLELGVATVLFHFFNGLIFIGMGIDRSVSDRDEQSTGEYSLSTYTIAVLGGFLTLIFVGEVAFLY